MDKDSMKCLLEFLQDKIKKHEEAKEKAKRDEDEFRILYNGGCISAYKSVVNWLENMG